MIVTSTLDEHQNPTEEQLDEIRKAAAMPIVFDEDAPELTDAMEKAFIVAAKSRNRFRKTG